MATSVGLREFKDKVSSYIERVEAGDVVTVTKRGKPVARVIPAGVSPGMASLLAEGKLRWSGGAVAAAEISKSFGAPLTSPHATCCARMTPSSSRLRSS